MRNDWAGEKNPKFRGGLFQRNDGRWVIVCRDLSSHLYYRAVMEAELRRPLRDDEVVHHINGDCSDDRLENLEVTVQAKHAAQHSREMWVERKRRWKYDWSENHERCAECGTTDRPHGALGLCERCYRRDYDARKAAA